MTDTPLERGQVSTAPPSVTVSSGTVDITPEHLLALGGYAKRLAPFDGIAHRLEANVLVVAAGASRAVIVSTDLLYAGDSLRSALLQNLGCDAEWTGLFLCASHTHFAPMTVASMPRLGIADREYIGFVARRITALIRTLESRAVPALCSYHQGSANHSMNRRFIRRRLMSLGRGKRALWGPNPEGVRDETIRLLKFCDSGSRPLAIIWNYACHPNAFPEPRQISAEYPGVVRASLRVKFGYIPILFMQGFGGDVRPPFLGVSGLKGVARRIVLGPQFRRPMRREWEQWAAGLANSVQSVAQSPPAPVALDAPVVKRIELPEHEFAVGGAGTKSLFWHVIDCGGFRIVGINAEPVVEYRRLIEPYVTGVPLLTVGCVDQTHCYLPVDRMVPEGGYEVEGFRRLFSFEARFRERLQELVVRRLIEGLR